MFLNRSTKIKMTKDFILSRDLYEAFLEVLAILTLITHENRSQIIENFKLLRSK